MSSLLTLFTLLTFITQLVIPLIAPPCQLPQSWVGELEYSPTQGWQIEVETDYPDGGFIFTRVGNGWQGWIHPSKPDSIHTLYHFTAAALTGESLPCTIAFSLQLQSWLQTLARFDSSLTNLFLPFIRGETAVSSPPPKLTDATTSVQSLVRCVHNYPSSPTTPIWN